MEITQFLFDNLNSIKHALIQCKQKIHKIYNESSQKVVYKQNSVIINAI